MAFRRSNASRTLRSQTVGDPHNGFGGDSDIDELLEDVEMERHKCSVAQCERYFSNRSKLGNHKRNGHWLFYVCNRCIRRGRTASDYILDTKRDIDLHYERYHHRIKRHHRMRPFNVKEIIGKEILFSMEWVATDEGVQLPRSPCYDGTRSTSEEQDLSSGTESESLLRAQIQALESTVAKYETDLAEKDKKLESSQWLLNETEGANEVLRKELEEKEQELQEAKETLKSTSEDVAKKEIMLENFYREKMKIMVDRAIEVESLRTDIKKMEATFLQKLQDSRDALFTEKEELRDKVANLTIMRESHLQEKETFQMCQQLLERELKDTQETLREKERDCKWMEKRLKEAEDERASMRSRCSRRDQENQDLRNKLNQRRRLGPHNNNNKNGNNNKKRFQKNSQNRTYTYWSQNAMPNDSNSSQQQNYFRSQESYKEDNRSTQPFFEDDGEGSNFSDSTLPIY